MSFLMRFIIGFLNKLIEEIQDFMLFQAKNKGKVGSIETLKWISEGEDTETNESLNN